MLVTLVQMEAQEPWETHTEQDFEVAKLSERKPDGAPTRQDSGTPGGGAMICCYYSCSLARGHRAGLMVTFGCR